MKASQDFKLAINKNIKLIYIDLFCGAGGTSTGVDLARHNGFECAKVVACVNHDKNAIASHQSNHPEALHFTEDIRTLELSQMIKHVEKMKAIYPNAFIVLWASLECTNFSKAKGGLPRDVDSRTLAEHLFRYIESINPDYVQIENVEEFMSWGDVDENGKPISMDKGKSFEKWVGDIKQYGYKFDYRVLNSANYGAYTSRKRFFGIFAKNDLPIVFPEQTHTKKVEVDLFGSYKKWKPVKDVLDFNDEGTSIFTRKKALSDKTLERIYAGLVKFVAGGKEKWILKYNSMSKNGKHNPPGIDEPCPVVACQNRLGVVTADFLTKYFGGQPENKVQSVTAPCGTLTTKDRYSKVSVHFLSKQYSGHPDSKNIGVDGPAGTITTKDHHVFVTAYYGNGFNTSIESPAPTVTTKDRFSLVSSQFLSLQCRNESSASVDHPTPAIATTPKHNLVVIDRFLMNPQYNSAGGSINKPCFTLIARMDKMPPYLITTKTGDICIEVYESDSSITTKIKEFMAIYGVADIKMRMLKVPELKRIMGFPENYTLIGTQAEQKKYIGNAVEVTMAKVLCEALC